MRLNSIKSFFKYLLKHRLYTFVTVTGFAISLMFVFLLSVYIKQELSVDQFQIKKDRIYRLIRDNSGTFAPPIGDFIKSQYPEVESFTRTYYDVMNAKFPDNLQEKVKIIFADSTFFNIFSFKLKEGVPDQVLALKNSALLSSSFALKIFGKKNPMGRTFSINQVKFTISGIFNDLPQNTSFKKAEAILNFNILGDLWYKEVLTTNDVSSFGLYFLAKKGADLPSKAPQILEQFRKDYWPFSDGYSKTLQFEPLSEVYFSKASGIEIKQNTHTTVLIFVSITLLILAIAIINYINLTVAQVGFRVRESAIKRIMGISKIALIRHHILESVSLSFLAALLALYLAFIFEPWFNSLMDCQLNLSSQFNLSDISIMMVIIIAIGFISGIVPAMVVRKHNPINVIKGNFTQKTKSSYSKVLISFQYTIAILLIICTWTIVRQSRFMENFNLGFNKENLFWMENTIKTNQKTAFYHELKSIPGVIDVSFCRGTPLSGGNNQSFNFKGKPVSFQEFVVDSSFFKIMKMSVHNTISAYAKNGIWLNKTAIKLLGLGKDPVTFSYYNQELPILGIVDDFNFTSLHNSIGPVIIRQLKDDEYPWDILVKLDGSNLLATVKEIKSKQESFTGGIPMESGFVDDALNHQYNKELKQSQLIGAFTLLSIIISSMGIFAMALFYMQQKVKEIGIRKINGARISEILEMLNKDIIKWVLLSFILSTPVAWFIMQKWLQNYAYKTDLKWWIFAISGCIALFISLLTVSWQSWRAATMNPVKALRFE